MRMLTTFVLLSLLVASGCRARTDADSQPSASNPSDVADSKAGLLVTGTVRHIQLEGGFYGIVAEDGRRYDPVNLPEAFRQDGLELVCRVRPARDAVSFRMWGQLVEILDIQQR